MSRPHKTFNTQFPASARRSPKNFRYEPVLKTEVPEIRTVHSSTVHDPTQCSSYILAKHFILLNSRLNDLSIESKNARSEVWIRKLWSSEVDAANSQGCVEMWAHPRLPFYLGFCCPGTQCSISDSPKTP